MALSNHSWCAAVPARLLRRQLYQRHRLSPAPDARSPGTNSRFNLALPSSSCPHCGSAIKPQHNLPVGSYLWLRGRSACCSERISKRYLVTEITTGLLGVLVYLWLLNQQPDAHELAAGLLPSLLLVWWLVAITAMLWHSSKDTQALWQSLLWLGLIANLQRTTPALNEAILAVCTVYVSALLATTIQALMQRRNGSSAEQVSYLALSPSWHGLAALVAWFSWPGAEALSLGAAAGAIVAAFECRFAPKIGAQKSPVVGSRGRFSMALPLLSAPLG